LLLALNPDCQVLARFPINLVTLGMVVDEVAAIATLLLVEVCFGDGLVGEKVVVDKLKDEAETRLLEILHPDVRKMLQRGLVPIRDHLGQ